MEFFSHPSLSVQQMSQPAISKSASPYYVSSSFKIISHLPGQDPVLHPNEIWRHQCLTGMICMIYKEIVNAFILV